MKHAHGVHRKKKRRRKIVADSGAAVGEVRWAVIVSCYFSLRAEGPKENSATSCATKRKGRYRGAALEPATF